MLAVVVLVLMSAAAARGQELRGLVRDSTSGLPVPGAVISLFDANNVALARNLSNERGRYQVVMPQPATRLRVVRLGYRPRDVPLPDGTHDLDITLVAIPPMLETVHIMASAKCPSRKDGPAALALLEQARSGLLSTIVAREANPATLKLLDFRQIMDGDQPTHLTVRVDMTEAAATSFVAAKSGADFVRYGFAHDDSLGVRVLSGPDADVLLDDGFAAGYCFRIQDATSGRPHQVGLAFFPADHKGGRTDIEGTLWIDTVGRSLRDIDFRYVGMPGNQGVDPGGHVYFREMPNGVVLIDRWVLRTGMRSIVRGRVNYVPVESGGEIARARWSDGRTWEDSLGALTVHLVNAAGRPVPHAIVALDSTEYIGTSDSLGNVVIRDLMPGPYTVVFVDTALAHSAITFKSTFTFVSHRGRTDETVLHVPSEDEFLQVACRSGKDRHWVHIVAVNDFDGSPASLAFWDIGSELGTDAERVVGKGTVREDGTRGICIKPPDHMALQIRARHANDPQRFTVEKLDNAEAVVLRVPAKARP
jgi:hypothetical protein